MITTGSLLKYRSLRILASLAILWTFVSTALAAGVVGIERILVTVSDLDRAEGFYRDGLGFETVGRAEIAGDGFAHLVGLRDGRATTLTMRLGQEEVTFVKYGAPGKPYPADSRSPDRWFQHFAIVVSDMDKAYAQLQRVGFTPISNAGPVTLPPANGFVRAFKFRDPDGHPLELTSHLARAGGFGPGTATGCFSASTIRRSASPIRNAAKPSTRRCLGWVSLTRASTAVRPRKASTGRSAPSSRSRACVRWRKPGRAWSSSNTAPRRPAGLRQSTRNPTTLPMSNWHSRLTTLTAWLRSSGKHGRPLFRPTRWIWATACTRRWSATPTGTRSCWSRSSAEGAQSLQTVRTRRQTRCRLFRGGFGLRNR